MKIIGGSASGMLAGELARVLDADLVETEFRRFPDGEGYARILGDLNDERVLLVQTTLPDPNIVELFLWQDAVNDFDIESLITLTPYFGYSRQDKAFESGEAVSARAIAERIELFTDEVVVVDIHNSKALEYFEKPVTHLTAAPAFARYLDGKVDIVLSPDEGRVEMANGVSEILGTDTDYLEKIRHDATTVEIKTKSLDVTGKRVAIVDDIISTGGTLGLAAKQLKEEGVESIIALCTHGLFIGDAMDKLYNCAEVISTDTVESEHSKISVAQEIADAIG
ncbi:MAG: ribose-phosphate diphosphokinase [Thermoplasmata archaeon]